MLGRLNKKVQAYMNMRMEDWCPTELLVREFVEAGGAPTEVFAKEAVRCLLKLEQHIMSKHTAFAHRLCEIAREDAECDVVLLTKLNLVGWLVVLNALGGAEDADLYWVVSRGFRVYVT